MFIGDYVAQKGYMPRLNVSTIMRPYGVGVTIKAVDAETAEYRRLERSPADKMAGRPEKSAAAEDTL